MTSVGARPPPAGPPPADVASRAGDGAASTSLPCSVGSAGACSPSRVTGAAMTALPATASPSVTAPTAAVAEPAAVAFRPSTPAPIADVARGHDIPAEVMARAVTPSGALPSAAIGSDAGGCTTIIRLCSAAKKPDAATASSPSAGRSATALETVAAIGGARSIVMATPQVQATCQLSKTLLIQAKRSPTIGNPARAAGLCERLPSAACRTRGSSHSSRNTRSRRSWRSCASMLSVAIGRASSRRRPIGSSVSSQ